MHRKSMTKWGREIDRERERERECVCVCFYEREKERIVKDIPQIVMLTFLEQEQKQELAYRCLPK